MAKFYSGIDTSVGIGAETLDGMLSNGSTYGISPSQDIDCQNMSIAGITTTGGNIMPDADDSHDLGSSTKRWRNIFTGDLQLSNVVLPSNTDEPVGIGNEVDGTQGTWTIQEGANDLFIINRVNGKKYKFNLTEVS
jgi:hypothetical protein